MARPKARPIPAFTIGQLADELGIATSTVSRRLGSIDPVGKRGGSAVYRLKHFGVALFGKVVSIYDQDAPPADRKAFFQSENERLRFESTAGALIPAEEVRESVAEAFKMVSERLEILTDELERDVGLDPHQIEIMRQRIRQMKSNLVSSLIEESVLG